MTKAQQTVLYTLAGSVIVTVIAILLANLGVFGAAAQSSKLATWGPVGALAEIIGLFVFVAKIIFKPNTNKFSLLIGSPDWPENMREAMREFDITRIQWVQEECFVLYGANGKQSVRILPNRVGRGFRIQLPEDFFENISNSEPLELQLKDRKGNRWEVRPFLPLENLLPLSAIEPLKKIITDYAEDDE